MSITSLNSRYPPESSAQNVEKKKVEPVTPHFLSLNQDIVATVSKGEVWIKVCNLQSSKETELFAETLNGHGDFFDDFPLVLSAKTEY